MVDQNSKKFWEIFFEVYEALPRQGPGNRASAARALSYCTELRSPPSVLDLGCGAGAQTLYLAEMIPGKITAVDNHAPFIDRLNNELTKRGITEQVRALVGDMARPPVSQGSIDLIWSEGALYNIGIENALGLCFELLHPGGYLVFTDAVWTKKDPPPEVKASFDIDYPGMGSIDDVNKAINICGFKNIAHFTLPDEAWWSEFYTPMELRIKELYEKYHRDAEVVEILDVLAREPEMHRQNSGFYAYEYFIVQRPDN